MRPFSDLWLVVHVTTRRSGEIPEVVGKKGVKSYLRKLRNKFGLCDQLSTPPRPPSTAEDQRSDG